MSTASERESSWYWVFALPVIFIACAWTIDELNIDEDVYLPALVFSGISMFVIYVSRKKHAERTGRKEQGSWWPWLIVGPAMFVAVTYAIDELGIDEDVYIPAFVFTFVASIIAFAKKKRKPVAAPGDGGVPVMLAAETSETSPVRVTKSPSWFWAVLIAITGITVIAVTSIMTDADLERRRLDADHAQRLMSPLAPKPPAWPEAVWASERQHEQARLQAERAVRSAERQVEEIERRVRRTVKQAKSDAEMEALLAERETTELQLAEARQLVVQAKTETRQSLEEARTALQQTIQKGNLDVRIEDLAVDDDGLILRVIRDGQVLIARINADGLTVESADDPAEDDVECTVAEGESDESVVAECDEQDWDAEHDWDAGHDWEQVASEIHQALFAEDEQANREVVVALATTPNSQADWKDEWLESAARPQPDWVDAEDDYSGRTHQIVAITGPCKSQAECQALRDGQLASAVADYASVYLGMEGEQIAPWYGAAKFRLPRQRVREYVKDEYYTIHESSTDEVGQRPMIYTLLEFDVDFRQKLIKTHRQQSVTLARMARAGIGSLGLLGLLASVFGYLKMDEQSSGQKRGRLKFGTIGIIAAICLLCAVGVCLFPLI